MAAAKGGALVPSAVVPPRTATGTLVACGTGAAVIAARLTGSVLSNAALAVSVISSALG